MLLELTKKVFLEADVLRDWHDRGTIFKISTFQILRLDLKFSKFISNVSAALSVLCVWRQLVSKNKKSVAKRVKQCISFIKSLFF